MATIPSGQKFHTLASTVDTKERGSASANAKREIYTMQDIIDTVSGGGSVLYIGDDTTVVGRVYTFESGTWTEVDADAEGTTKGLLGLALGTNSTADGMLVQGLGTLATAPASLGTVYVSGTAGELTSTQPVTGYVRVAGYCVDTNVVYFNPSQDYLTLA